MVLIIIISVLTINTHLFLILRIENILYIPGVANFFSAMCQQLSDFISIFYPRAINYYLWIINKNIIIYNIYTYMINVKSWTHHLNITNKIQNHKYFKFLRVPRICHLSYIRFTPRATVRLGQVNYFQNNLTSSQNSLYIFKWSCLIAWH